MRAGLLLIVTAFAACDEHFPDPVLHGTVAPPVDDAGADGGPSVDADAGVPITVISHAPAPGGNALGALGAPASVTWAAYADDLGWHALGPSAPGTYAFRAISARWAVALVCAAPNNAEVVVASRSTNVRTLDLAVAGLCTPIPPTSFADLSGQLTHAPPTTTLLELGYGNGSGSRPVTVDGAGAGPYTFFGVQTGSVDFAYGTRDSANGPLTRIVIQRGQSFTGAPHDVDFATAIVPGEKSVTVAGVDAAESLVGQVRYTTGGCALGIGVSPATLASTFAYATVPDANRVEGDLYRLDVTAGRSDQSERSVSATFATALDLATNLPPPLDTPTFTIVKEPYQRIETVLPLVSPIALTTIDASAMPSASSRYRWVTTTDLMTTLDVTMPNLAVVPGFDPAWALPRGTPLTVVVTRNEPVEIVGDGTRSRSSARTSILSGE